MTRITKPPSNQLFYHLMKAPPGLPTLVGLDVDWPGVLQSEWRVAKAILQSVWREANKIRKQIFSQSHWNKCASSQTTAKMRKSHEKPLKRKAVKRCKKSDAKCSAHNDRLGATWPVQWPSASKPRSAGGGHEGGPGRPLPGSMAYCRTSNDGKWRDVEVFRGSGTLADYSTMAYRSLQTQVDRGNLFHEVAFQHAWSLVESSFLRARLVRRVYFNCMSWHLLWWSGDNWSGYLQGHGARPHHWHRWCENLNSIQGEETLYKHKKKHLAVVCNCSSIKCPNSLHSLCQVCGVVGSEIEGGTRGMLHGILTQYTESGGKSQMFIYTAFFMSMASKLETIFVSDCLAATAAARTWGWRKRHWWVWWAHQKSFKIPSGQSCQIKATIVLYSHILLTRGNRIFHLTGGRSGGGERFRTISWVQETSLPIKLSL